MGRRKRLVLSVSESGAVPGQFMAVDARARGDETQYFPDTASENSLSFWQERIDRLAFARKRSNSESRRYRWNSQVSLATLAKLYLPPCKIITL